MQVRELIASLGLEIDEKSFAKGEAAIEGLHHGFATFAAGAAVAVTGALVYFTKETAEAADAAGKLAQSTGLNSEFLQRLGYAANLADVSTETLTVGLRHLAKTGVKDVQGAVLKLADQFHKMPDDGAKVELAMEKFGRSGAELIPVLNKGSEALKELMAEKSTVFTEEDSRKAEEFNEELKKLGKSLTSVRNTIGLALLPYLTKLTKGMLTFVRALKGAMPSLRTFAAVIKTVVIFALSALIASLVSTALASEVTLGWFIALKLGAVAAAVQAAAAWAVAALPFVVIAGLITALILLLQDLYVFVNGGQSMIGKLLPSFEQFLFEFTRPRKDEPWFIHMLRFAVDLLTGAQEKVSSLNTSLSSIGLGKIDTGKPMTADSINRQVFGGTGAESPASPRHMTAPGEVRHFTFNSPITVNASTGADPKEIAGHVAKAVDEQLKSANRAAAAGIE